MTFTSQTAGLDEWPSLRHRILDAAVGSLIEQGTAKTTTLEVQRRAQVSRGALLHHFPTHSHLLASTVGELVRRNEQSVRESLSQVAATGHTAERAIRALASATSTPAYLAELELWAVSRTDPELQTLLRHAEQAARKEYERVLVSLAPANGSVSAHLKVMDLTMEFLRGLALSGVLRRNKAASQRLLAAWIQASGMLMEGIK